MSTKRPYPLVLALALAIALTFMVGCGQMTGEVSETGNDEPAEATAEAEAAEAAEAAGEAGGTDQAAKTTVDPAKALAAKEADLARREAEIASKERAQAAAAAKEAARVTVPAGTELAVELLAPITTKTAQVGDLVDARLASALSVNGRLVAPAGATVRGTVTEVVSGSNKIGGKPTLGLTFDGLELAGGGMASISGVLIQQGKSETAKDSAKIAGATVAGAIIGHQIDDDKGKIIGGLLGGAAGTAAAKKTGGEVEVPEGTVLYFLLDAPVELD
jgi:hypothetical protein